MRYRFLQSFLALLAFCLVPPLRAQTITTRVVDYGSGGITGKYDSLAIVNGNPAIAYYNQTDSMLMFARNDAADGSGGWAISSLDRDGAVGLSGSLSIVNGRPAISYCDGTNDNLKYVRANDASGTTWGAPVIVASIGNGGHTSLATVNGMPAIAYYDGTDNHLKYVRALDVDGTSWGAPVTLDNTADVGGYATLLIVNGNPAVGYRDFTNSDLKYVRAVDLNGTAWGVPVTVDGVSTSVGSYASMAIVNGNPALSYYDSAIAKQDLKYVRATDADGAGWGTPVTVASSGNVGQYTSLAVVNGNPAISYHDAGSIDLKFVRASDVSGTAWAAPVTVDSTGDVGTYTSLKIVDGYPAISYHDATNGNLKFARASNVGGTAWPAPATVDAGTQSGDVGTFSSQAIVNGHPAIAYYDDSNNDLKYVRATAADGTGWGTPLTVDNAGVTDVGWNPSMAIVNGTPAIAYYDNTNSDLRYVRANDADGTNWGHP
jgi:hypothetical protein